MRVLKRCENFACPFIIKFIVNGKGLLTNIQQCEEAIQRVKEVSYINIVGHSATVHVLHLIIPLQLAQ